MKLSGSVNNTAVNTNKVWVARFIESLLIANNDILNSIMIEQKGWTPVKGMFHNLATQNLLGCETNTL